LDAELADGILPVTTGQAKAGGKKG